MEKLEINGLDRAKLAVPDDFSAKVILNIRRIFAVAGVALAVSAIAPRTAHAQMATPGSALGFVGRTLGLNMGQSSQADQAFTDARAMMRAEAAKIAENAVATTLIQTYGNLQIDNFAASRVEHLSLLAAGKVDGMVDQQPFLIVNPGQTIIDGIRAAMPTIVQTDLEALRLPADPQSVDNFIQRADGIALEMARNEGQLQMQRPDIFNEQVAAAVVNSRGRGVFAQREQEPLSALEDNGNSGGMNPQ